MQFDVALQSMFDLGDVTVTFYRSGGSFENSTSTEIDKMVMNSDKKSHTIQFDDKPAGIHVRATEDLDGSGGCSDGELWGETMSLIEYVAGEPENTLIQVTLGEAACPN